MAGLIHPLVWEASERTLDVLRNFTCFTMPPDLYEDLRTAFKLDRAEDYIAVPQASLEQLIGWFAPDVAFVKRVWLAQSSKYTLRVFYLGKHDRSTAVRDLSSAFQLWLSVAAPQGRDSSLDTRLMDAVEDFDHHWAVDAIDTTLTTTTGRCVEPRQNLVFDLLTQGVAQHLANEAIVLGGKNWGRLIISGTKGDPFSGRELILFPPQQAPSDKHIGYWTEYVRVASMTSPESNRLRVVASVHVRNYAALGSFTSGPNQRRLDVFMRARGVSDGLYRHGEIPFRLHRDAEGKIKTRYSFRHGADLFKALRAFSGNAQLDADALPFDPIVGAAGLWVVPRLGRGFGDRFLPAGHGMSWPERDAFAENLDRLLGHIGLSRIAQVVRINRARTLKVNVPWWNPPKPSVEASERTSQFNQEVSERHAQRRALVKGALGESALRIVLFRLRDEAQQELVQALQDLLGTPAQQSDLGNEHWHWIYDEGLVVEAQIRKSGALAQPLPFRPGLTEEEKSRFAKSKHADILRHRHQKLLDEREDVMRSYVQSVVSSWTEAGPWIGLLEMPQALYENPLADPYTRSYRAIADLKGVPQAILVEEDGTANEYKVPGALRDGIRMIGVAGLAEIQGSQSAPLPQDLRLIGLWTVRRNQDATSNDRRSAQTFPVVLSAHQGKLQVALMNEDERGWSWMTYAEACSRIATRNVPSFDRSTDAQRRGSFSQFFREVVESLLLDGKETIVFVDAENIRREVSSLSNRELTLGTFELQGLPGKSPLRITDGGKVSVLRLNSESTKRASYCRSINKHHVYGTFREPGRTRTYWSVRKPPLAMDANLDLRSAMQWTRRDIVSASPAERFIRRRFRDDRLAPVLEEVVVVTHSKIFDPDTLAILARKLQFAHVSWQSATILPYPLHEASRLAGDLK